jgi:GT2 family glycosyltransferase
MRIAIGICTTGRPDTAAECVRRAKNQTRPADRVVVCGASPADVAAVVGAEVLVSPRKGLTVQRNLVLDAVASDIDILVFIDDDFLLHPTYLERVETLFSADSALAALTGKVIADGINDPAGFTFEEAEGFLKAARLTAPQGENMWTQRGVYGCNFAVRVAMARDHQVRFDERLPLYGWQEDVDFAAQLARHGRVMWNDALLGVHLGVKGGRQSGVRLGYSQVSNIIYLMRKGTLSLRAGLNLMARNLAANAAGALVGGGPVDRLGRLRGNLLAIYDVTLRQRVTPERILEL